MKRFFCGFPGGFLFLTAIVFSASAQTQTLVVPGAYSDAVANTSDNAPLGAADQHIQQDYSGSLLSSSGLVPGDQITAIGFRIAAGESGLAAQTVADYSIWMGLANVSPGGLSSTLADNGSDMTLVRSGALSIANGQFSGGAGINPFGMIQLSTPYTYFGGDLLIEITYSGFASGADVAAEYPYDSTLAQTAFGSGPNSTTADQGLYNEAIVMAFNVLPVGASPVPEPGSIALFACGMAGFFLVARQRRC